MAKTINLEFKGVQYNLEYTRRSVEIMERQGFKLSDIDDKPVTAVPTLIRGAFLAHHKFIKPEVVEDIHRSIKNKGDFIGKLAEMYNEPLIEMMEEPEESEGNLDWDTSW